MKNFSIVGTRLACALLGTVLAAPAWAFSCEFKPNAPDQHLVVKGDTLWDISGKFLEHPWCWPTVWGLNKEDIKNPHWIYPGQTIYFDRENKRLSLTKPGIGGAAGTGMGTGAAPGDPTNTRMTPQLRTEGLGKEAIASIPASIIEPFLSQPIIIESDELKGAPVIAATREGRVNLGKNDTAYVRGDLKGGESFQVFRPGKAIKDPVTGKVLAYEGFYLGTVKLQRASTAKDEPHTFVVGSSKEEMGVGDMLKAAPPTPLLSYVPHEPYTKIDARVASIYGESNFAAKQQIVLINRGSLDGIDIGSTLQLYHLGKTVKDPTVDKGWSGMRSGTMKIPDDLRGTLFIFRVFKKVSYGLIMEATEPLAIGDVARSPE